MPDEHHAGGGDTLTETDAGQILPFYQGPELELLTRSVLAGNSAAQCWVSEDNAWALLWDRCNNVLYVGGRPGAVELAELLAEEVHPAAARAGRPYLRGRGMDESATLTMEQVLDPYAPVRGKWRLSAYLAPSVDVTKFPPASEGVSVVPIDQELLKILRPAGVEGVVEEITQMWASLSAFEERGLGYAAIRDGTVACWCTTEYMSEDRCGVGIWTAPTMRRKGIAALTAATCVAEGLRRGIVLHWDCAVRNVPSVRLAEKLGFELLEESELLHWKLT